MMKPEILLGLYISLIGLTITFAALGLLILIMRLLLFIFPAVEEKPAESAVSKKEEEMDEQRREEMAVAVAVGISLLDSEQTKMRQDPSLGKLLEHQD